MWTALGWRVLAACPFAVGGVLLLTGSAAGATDRRLLGMVGILTAAIVVAPGLAGLIAEPTGSLFYPSRRAAPEPRRSIAEARRARGDYRAALAAYEEVLAEFPTDVVSWCAMVEMAMLQLRDRALGDALARRALAILADDGARHELVRAHRRAAERLRAASIQL